jgi:hypothetical protein
VSVTLTDEQAKNIAASLRNMANTLDPPVTIPAQTAEVGTPLPPIPSQADDSQWHAGG